MPPLRSGCRKVLHGALPGRRAPAKKMVVGVRANAESSGRTSISPSGSTGTHRPTAPVIPMRDQSDVRHLGGTGVRRMMRDRPIGA